jgi:hypothetical protein
MKSARDIESRDTSVRRVQRGFPGRYGRTMSDAITSLHSPILGDKLR